MKRPRVSFVICSYQGENLIGRLLESIFSQNYPSDEFEVIVVDGGSSDNTLEIVQTYSVTLLHNKKQYPEGPGFGKDQGIRKAKGEILVVVDQDNELQGKNWLSSVVSSFEKEKDAFGMWFPLLKKTSDPLINRYLSYIGTDPFAMYRSLEAKYSLNNLKNLEDKGDYFVHTSFPKDLLCTGGNCFAYRKSSLESIGGYSYDVEVIYSLVRQGFQKFIIPKHCLTHHITADSFWKFLRKRLSWSKYYSRETRIVRNYGWLPQSFKEYFIVFWFLFANFTFFPRLLQSFYLCLRDKDVAWLLHAPALFFVSFIYFRIAFSSFLKGRFSSL